MRNLKYFLWLCILWVPCVKFSAAQGSDKYQKVKEIMVIRQKLFNKQKNKPVSCAELKKEVKEKIFGPDVHVKDLDTLEEAQLNKYLKCPQTEWESVIERSAVELYKSQLMRGLNRLNIPLPRNITWSPSRCPCFNASATHLGSGKSSDELNGHWLIEINNSIDISIGEYAKIAALVTPIQKAGDQIIINSDPNAYVDVLDKDRTIFNNFIKRLAGHILNVPALDTKSISIGQPYLSLYAEYSINAQIFALAHELSHVILKHDFTTRGLVASDKGESILLEVSSFTEGLPGATSFRQEYAADSLGLEIMLAVIEANGADSSNQPADANIKGRTFGIYGAEMLLTWIELFQKAEITTYGAYAGATSHPPASERRNRIRRILQRKSLIIPERDFGLSTYKAMFTMWEALKPQWDSSLAPLFKQIPIKNECRPEN